MVNTRGKFDSIPLVASFRQTREIWLGFSRRQKVAAIGAAAVTVGRLGARIALERNYDEGGVSQKTFVTTGAVIDAADKLDGTISKGNDASTEFGKELDPLADKADFFIQELFRVARGEMELWELTLRLGRDVFSTYIRHLEVIRHEMHPELTSHAGAKWPGKLSTFLRSISLRINDIAPDSEIAKVSRHLTTGALLGSAALNAHRYLKDSPEDTRLG